MECTCDCCHGACCCGPNCSIKSCVDCVKDGGVFLGPKTTCDQGCEEEFSPLAVRAMVVAEIETGACCVDGVCQIASKCECDSLGGDYKGVGTDCDPDPCAGRCCSCVEETGDFAELLPIGTMTCPESLASFQAYAACVTEALSQIASELSQNGYVNVYSDTVEVGPVQSSGNCKCHRYYTKADPGDSCPSGWTDGGDTCEIYEDVDSCADCSGSDVVDCGISGGDACDFTCEYYELIDAGLNAYAMGTCKGHIDYDNPVTVILTGDATGCLVGGDSVVIYPCIQKDCNGEYASCDDGVLEADCPYGEFTLGATCGDPFDCTTEPPP